MSKTIRRFDQGQIRNANVMEDGRLKADVIVSRIGVLVYRNADGSLRRELRDPDEVFKAVSLKTMEMIPITLGHPQAGIVNSDNAKELQVGQTGENIRVDSPYIRSTMTINQEQAINNVRAGNEELSLGYTLQLDETPGEWRGERYDAIQRNIEYNHLAIVPKARAGKEARITLDSNEAVQTNQQTEKEPEMETKNLIKVNVDGLPYDAAPEVDKFIAKQTSRIDGLEAEAKSASAAMSTLQANFDSQKEELDTLKAVNMDEEVRKAVGIRLKLEREAATHLDEETVKKFDGMSDQEIKLEVIKKKSPKANMDKKDEAYIDARYDAALEVTVEDSNSLATQRLQMNGDSAEVKKQNGDKGVRTANDAKDDFQNRVQKAHLPTETK